MQGAAGVGQGLEEIRRVGRPRGEGRVDHPAHALVVVEAHAIGRMDGALTGGEEGLEGGFERRAGRAAEDRMQRIGVGGVVAEQRESGDGFHGGGWWCVAIVPCRGLPLRCTAMVRPCTTRLQI